MADIISIVNNKGGVGKTITTKVLSELVAYLGYRVLNVDLDESGNLSMAYHAHVEDTSDVINGVILPGKENIHELFKCRYNQYEDVKRLICGTNVNGIHILPSSKRHKNSPTAISLNTGNNNTILKRALKSVQDDYDFIFIDHAPADNILTVNSFHASDYLIVPVRLEKYSYKGLSETLASILYIKEEHDLDKPQFLGAFITHAETNTKLYKEIRSQYEHELGDGFLKTAIRKDISIGNLQTNFTSIIRDYPKTNALLDYSCLLLEMKILDKSAEDILRESISNMDEI